MALAAAFAVMNNGENAKGEEELPEPKAKKRASHSLRSLMGGGIAVLSSLWYVWRK